MSGGILRKTASLLLQVQRKGHGQERRDSSALNNNSARMTERTGMSAHFLDPGRSHTSQMPAAGVHSTIVSGDKDEQPRTYMRL